MAPSFRRPRAEETRHGRGEVRGGSPAAALEGVKAVEAVEAWDASLGLRVINPQPVIFRVQTHYSETWIPKPSFPERISLKNRRRFGIQASRGVLGSHCSFRFMRATMNTMVD